MDMRRVLHIGPCESPGGMAKVMQILADNPPDGWDAQLLSTHVKGNPFSKLQAYRKAMKVFKRMINDDKSKIDLIHVHAAADWSWRRKKRFVRVANKFSIPCLIHIHSGQFENWLNSPTSTRSAKIRAFINDTNSVLVVLNNQWKQKLQPYVGHCNVISNPIDPIIIHDSTVIREKSHLLLLGRNEPVKGHSFAVELGKSLIPMYPDLQLTMTGIEQSAHEWVNAKGWVSEKEKLNLLQTASLLIAPSAYEGQPLAVLEALASGLPCLASDKILQLPDTVNYAEFENVDSWKKKVQDIFSRTDEGENLVSSVSSFRITEISKKWKLLYDNQFN